MPTSRSHPTWKLGIAAYWLVNDGGWRTRYASECRVTVSMNPRSMSRGGATGNVATITIPTNPEISNALR
jgi:hypothetical protein